MFFCCISLCPPGPSDRQSKLVQYHSEKLGCLQMVHSPDPSAAPAAMVLQPARRVVASLLYNTKLQWTGQTHICIKGKRKTRKYILLSKACCILFPSRLSLSFSLSLYSVFLTIFWKVLLFYSSLSFCIAAVNVNSVGSVFCLGFKMFYSFSDAV